MPYVTNITYNQYGERQRIDYGNGTFTEYDYDDLRRMQNLGHQFFGAASTYTVEKEYAYDKVSNVIQIETLNNGQLLPNTEDGVLAGPILHNYYYDDFNRLIGADGWYVGPDDEPSALLRQEYTLDMAYDESHNILNKAQNHLRGSADPNDTSVFLNNISEAMEDTAYNLDYEDYASGSFTTGGHSYVQPHAPRTIVEYPFGAGADEPSAKRKLLDYDANGNLLLVEQEISDPEDPLGKAKISLRENLWDEENRLLAVDLKPEAPSNKPEVAAYTYDASGERTIKYLAGRMDAYYSAKAAGSADRLEAIIYPSPLLTVKTRPLPDRINPEVLERTSITKYTKHYYIGTERISSAIGTMKNLGLLCENNWPGSQGIVEEMGDKTLVAGNVLTADYDAFEKELQLPEPFLYRTYLPCEGKYHEPINYDAYWYHPDHLGSSSYITNTSGEVSQHMEYLPFGETLVEEHLNSYNSSYKFNAKEYDAETGWYYYGARYYNPKWSIWLGVDPASELYPSFSPYAYTLQNPLRYVDPTGMVVQNPVYDSKGNYRGDTEEGFTGEAIIYDGNKDFSNMSKDELVDNGGQYYGEARRGLNKDAQSKILTNILNCFELPNGTILDSNENFDISIGKDRIDANASYHGMENGKHQIEDNTFYYEYTVENIRATLGNHEIYGHGILKLGGGWTESHLKVFLISQENAPKGVTNKWLENNLGNIIRSYPLARRKAAPREYYMEYLKTGGEKIW